MRCTTLTGEVFAGCLYDCLHPLYFPHGRFLNRNGVVTPDEWSVGNHIVARIFANRVNVVRPRLSQEWGMKRERGRVERCRPFGVHLQ